METYMASGRGMDCFHWRDFQRAELLIKVTVICTALLGCSQDGPSIATGIPCVAPVVMSSESKLGLVEPPGATTTGDGLSITLKWDASSQTLGYRLYIGTRSHAYQQVEDVGLLTTSVVSSLTNDMTYYFVVTAYNSAGESCPSNEVNAYNP